MNGKKLGLDWSLTDLQEPNLPTVVVVVVVVTDIIQKSNSMYSYSKKRGREMKLYCP